MSPIAVSFPLRGEWLAVNTPGHQIPSHGTHELAQTYAYDFIQLDWNFPKSFRFYKKGVVSAYILGVRLEDCLGWSSSIHAPFSGEVIEASDGIRERNPVHIVRDLSVVLKNSFTTDLSDVSKLKTVLGNYIVLKGDGYYAMFAHAREGSIAVNRNQQVTLGQKLAEVGHSGNSTAPHLHFQLMDGPDLRSAKGLPCCFDQYEKFEDTKWVTVADGIPTKTDRIRCR